MLQTGVWMTLYLTDFLTILDLQAREAYLNSISIRTAMRVKEARSSETFHSASHSLERGTRPKVVYFVVAEPSHEVQHVFMAPAVIAGTSSHD